MDQPSISFHENLQENLDAALRPPTCPACGESLAPFAGFARCPRCRFAICESCDGEPAVEVA
jgi:hypothetical protein